MQNPADVRMQTAISPARSRSVGVIGRMGSASCTRTARSARHASSAPPHSKASSCDEDRYFRTRDAA